MVDKIAAIGKAHNATPGQATLAWILAQGDEFVVIPGTKKVKVGWIFTSLVVILTVAKYLEENIGASDVKLSETEIEELRKIAVEAASLPGTRYSDKHMEFTLQDTPELLKDAKY